MNDRAALARIREVTGCGDNAEEVLRWMREPPEPSTVEEFDEKARVVAGRPVRRRLVSRLLLGVLTALALAGCGGSESGSDAGRGGSQITESEAVSPPPSASTNSVTEPHPTERTLTADPLGGLQYRPARIWLGEGAGGLIDSIRWRTYGGRTAIGVGVRVGVSSGSDRVTIRLRRKSECAGSPAYLQWSIEPERGGKPNFHDIMSPHVWLDTCYPEPEG